MTSQIIQGRIDLRFDQFSFSGGGLRCFWQGGALDVLREHRALAPKRIAAASGGALSAVCFIADCGTRLMGAFDKRLRRQDRNLELEPAADVHKRTPHEEIYRSVVADVLDRDACEAVADGPVFEVVLTRPPAWLPKRPAAALAMTLYETDKHLRSTPHGRFAKAVGARTLRVDARQAARDGRLAELICKAATIPPLFHLKEWDGQPVIDAGIIDDAPLPGTNEGATLVLLTRSYRNLPEIEGRTYLFPSHQTPAEKLDFTDADALHRTYDQGRRDMEQLITSVR